MMKLPTALAVVVTAVVMLTAQEARQGFEVADVHASPASEKGLRARQMDGIQAIS